MIQGSGLIWARSIREFSLSLHGARCDDGPLTRYVKLWVAHAPGMPGTFSPTLRVSDPDMHHGTCVTHVPWCKPGSLTSGFLWSWRREKRSRHSRCIRNPRFYVSGNMRESENSPDPRWCRFCSRMRCPKGFSFLAIVVTKCCKEPYKGLNREGNPLHPTSTLHLHTPSSHPCCRS